jgi:hypothetical protein
LGEICLELVSWDVNGEGKVAAVPFHVRSNVDNVIEFSVLQELLGLFWTHREGRRHVVVQKSAED